MPDTNTSSNGTAMSWKPPPRLCGVPTPRIRKTTEISNGAVFPKYLVLRQVK